MPAAGVPECPDHLDEIAKKEWNRICPILLAMRVLTDADYIALGTLCQAYGTLIDAQRRMNKTGILYKTESGYIQQSPLLSIIRGQQQVICALLREFGLTPSSRTRIQAGPAEDDAPVNKFARIGESPRRAGHSSLRR